MGSIRIAVVDDEPHVRALLATSISQLREDAVVEDFASGVDAVGRARDARFAAAVVDLFLPDIDGIETAEALRRLAPKIPLLFVTGRPDSPLAMEARAFPNALLLVKPMTLSVFTDSIALVLARATAPESGVRDVLKVT